MRRRSSPTPAARAEGASVRRSPKASAKRSPRASAKRSSELGAQVAARRLPSPGREILSKFERLDTNGDGIIELAELAEVLQHLDDVTWTSERVSALMSAIDKSGNSKIRCEDFLHWAFAVNDSNPFEAAFRLALDLLPASACDSKENTDWRVVRREAIEILEEPIASSTRIGSADNGTIVCGRQVGDWLVLSDELGFIFLRDAAGFMLERVPALTEKDAGDECKAEDEALAAKVAADDSVAKKVVAAQTEEEEPVSEDLVVDKAGPVMQIVQPSEVQGHAAATVDVLANVTHDNKLEADDDPVARINGKIIATEGQEKKTVVEELDAEKVVAEKVVVADNTDPEDMLLQHLIRGRPRDPSELLLPFLRGEGTDSKQRRFETIMEWDFQKMEKTHDYIQWLFPTDEESRFNKGAPEFTNQLQREARGDAKIQGAIRRSLSKFCWFLGLAVERQGKSVTISKADHFNERVSDCWSGIMNHNWHRISRVLHCLKLTRLDAEAAAFMACLELIAVEFPDVTGKTFGTEGSLIHWRARMRTKCY